MTPGMTVNLKSYSGVRVRLLTIASKTFLGTPIWHVVEVQGEATGQHYTASERQFIR
jgi:hypothetical protein